MVSMPSSAQENLPEIRPEQSLAADRERLKKIDRGDWWLWILAMVVMLLLTFTVVSMNFPGLVATQDPFFRFSLDQSVNALVALVLLFNLYSVRQQIILKKTRRELAMQMEARSAEQLRAAELQRQATTDPLTGLANRRTAEHQLKTEMARSRRRNIPLTVVAFDLDNFKDINDRYGHAAGDAVLRTFANKLSERRRGEDLVVRMGGDEFLLLLPECPAVQVPSLLSRIHPCEADFQGTGLPIEFSSGIASYDFKETTEQLLDRADQALYRDKHDRKRGVQRESVLA
jgi:diguanylate cyclase (GGDEF)-like protein